MTGTKFRRATAMFVMAVVVCGLLLTTGCVTQRHIDEVKQEIRAVKADTKATNDRMARLDSLLSAGATTDDKLRTDLRFSMDELQGQMSALLQNYNDLMTRVNEVYEIVSRRVDLRSSSGAQSTQSTNSGATAQTNPVPARPAVDCQLAYDSAFIAAQSSDYGNAITRFRQFLAACPDHESADDAYYWIGESFYAGQDYDSAASQFKTVVDKYPRSSKLSQALYKLARSHQEKGDKENARKYFQQVIDDFPDSFEARQSRDLLKELK